MERVAGMAALFALLDRLQAAGAVVRRRTLAACLSARPDCLPPRRRARLSRNSEHDKIMRSFVVLLLSGCGPEAAAAMAVPCS